MGCNYSQDEATKLVRSWEIRLPKRRFPTHHTSGTLRAPLTVFLKRRITG